MMIALPAPNNRRVQALLGLAAVLALAAPAALPQSSPQSQLTLQVEAPLVIEDIVVLDGNNKPIHNLKATSFTITDDGKPVTPQSFEEHAAFSPAQQAALQASMPRMPDLGVNVFTNYTPTPSDGPLNILLLDSLNTPMQDQVNVRSQMLKFLSTLPPGTSIAVFGLSTHLYLLQGFTSNPTVLKAALTAISSGPRASPLLDNPVSGGPGAEDQEAGVGLQMFLQGQIATYMIQQRTQRTLEAFSQLARYLSPLPGRKNLIWFSGSFPLDIYPSAAVQSLALASSGSASGDALTAETMFGSSAEAHAGGEVRQMDDLLRRSQIAIYPIDALGVLVDNSMDASQHFNDNQITAQQAEAQAAGAPGIGTGPGTGSISMSADAVNNFATQTAEEHATMNQMANETGGKAFYSSGDLKAATQSAISLGSNYYTLSYTPPSGAWDGKFHKIGIKVNQPGMHLTYRRGYFADDSVVDSHGKKHALPTALQSAMVHGAPQPSELLFDVRVIPDRLTTYLLDPVSHPNTKLMKPPYHSFQLDMLLDLHDVQVTRTTEPVSPRKVLRLDGGELGRIDI